MSLKAGIIGLPNVGKTSMFNALTNSQIEIVDYPFATITPNISVVEVADKRVDDIVKIFKPKKTVYATFELCDISGLAKGASKGEGLGNQFLAYIREVDAILHIVRCFEDENISHVEQGIDPLRDIEIIKLELILADLQTVENRINKVERKAKSNEKEALVEFNCLNKIKGHLLQNQMVFSMELSKEEINIIKNFSLLTLKPVIYIANMSEEEIVDYQNNEKFQQIYKLAEKENNKALAICAKLEAELVAFDKDSKTEFMKDLGIDLSSIDQVTKVTYDTLGLCTFFTVGEPEVKAWTFKKGMKAPECAGVIHSDFERGFIKAECYTFTDLINYGSEAGIKEKGLFRIEGKEYLVKDGDILHFRFNV